MTASARLNRAQWTTGVALAAASGLCVALILVRYVYAGGPMYYRFLIWNLLLAWIPVLLAFGVARRAERGRLGWQAWGLGALWLLFYPNAPYLATDLLHLRPLGPVPLWFDLLLLLAFAWTGLLAGFIALIVMQRVVAARRGAPAGWALAAAVSGLSGFGVYLGRFERWNSWDLLARPAALLADVAGRVLYPWEHARTVVFSGLFAAFLLVTYVLVWVLLAEGAALGGPQRAPDARRPPGGLW